MENLNLLRLTDNVWVNPQNIERVEMLAGGIVVRFVGGEVETFTGQDARKVAQAFGITYMRRAG